MKINRHKFMMAGTIILILALAGAAGWSYYKYYLAQQEISRLSTQAGREQVALEEGEKLISAVRKHMVLPDDEKPTIASVTDAESLKKDQPFFGSAANGDKVLVYAKARKAIIYSPTKDVIVNVGSVAIDGNKESFSQNAIVELRNGTNTSGLAKKVADKLKDIKELTIGKVGDSSKKDYDKTLIVDLGSPTAKQVLDSLTKVLEGAEVVSQLPAGEASSSADILIIIAKDQTAE